MSLYIRLKYADENGMVRCYTCGKMDHYKETHAWHYWHDRLDFEEDNLKPQCPYCNTYNADKAMAVYGAKLVEKLGLERFKELRIKAFSKGNDYSFEELKAIISKLEVFLKELRSLGRC